MTLVPAVGTTLTMGRGGYEGQLKIAAYPEGLAAVETTTVDRYLLGISEVPASWPAETLAAQAVAARTYLAWTLERGRTGEGAKYDYDICASQFCQVYRGPRGAADDWAEAVVRTVDEILTYDGHPAQALYSSSAGSMTRAVQDVFGGAAKPYLQPVYSPELDVTPYRSWELSISAAAFAEVFELGGYRFGGSIASVTMRSPGEGRGQVAVEVHTGRDVTVIPVTRFRAVFNVHGPELYPDVLPAFRPDGGRWPQTVLSYTFDVQYVSPTSIRRVFLPGDPSISGVLTITGEGWGHGVGMSQWGAMAMGRAGESYDSILDLYYGLTPVAGGAMLPDTVRVGLATEEPEITVAADGPFALVTGEFERVTVGAGEWVFRRSADGLVVVAPVGSVYDCPLLHYKRRLPRY